MRKDFSIETGALLQHVTGHVSKYAESFNERWLADALHPLGAAAFAALDRGGAAEFDTGARTTSDSLVCSGAVYVPRGLGFFEHNGRKTNFITNIMAMDGRSVQDALDVQRTTQALQDVPQTEDEEQRSQLNADQERLAREAQNLLSQTLHGEVLQPSTCALDVLFVEEYGELDAAVGRRLFKYWHATGWRTLIVF
ncbi:unnamed protein product, partial [Effrenium voratum]